jgi:GDPmannose 4,6-dehydratase
MLTEDYNDKVWRTSRTFKVKSIYMVGHMRSFVKMGDIIVKVDSRYFRPAEVETLLDNTAKAKAKLGWVPEITVEQMCAEMVANDLDSAKRHALLKQHGHTHIFQLNSL